MSADRPTQPPDETPLAGVSPVQGGASAEPPPPPVWESAAAAPAAVTAAIDRAAAVLMPAIDAVYSAITDTISNTSDTLGRAVASGTRAVKKVLTAAEERAAANLLALSDAGVKVSFSAPERAAEVADPTLAGIDERAQQTIAQATTAAPAAPAAAPEGDAPAPPPVVAGDGSPPPPVPPPAGPCPQWPYPRPGRVPVGQTAGGCAYFRGVSTNPGDPRYPAVVWQWWPFDWGGPPPLPPQPADPPGPPARVGDVWAVVCPCDTVQPPDEPPPPDEPAPDGCAVAPGDVTGPDGDEVWYLPFPLTGPELAPNQTLVIAGGDGRCWTAKPGHLPDPLPPNVVVVNDDRVPPGCKPVHGITPDCPKPPPPPPPDKPTEPAPPEPEPEPEPQTCPPPPPPIVIPACPKPDDPEPPPQVMAGVGAGAGAGTDVGSPTACAEFAARVATGPAPTDPTLFTPTSRGDVPNYTPGIAPGGWTIPGATARILPITALLERVSTHVASSVRDYAVGSALYAQAVELLPTAANPNWRPAIDSAARISVAKMAEEKTGMPMTYMFQSEIYYYQWANPQYIPAQSELDSAFLTNRITLADWECYTRMNGNKPELYAVTMAAKQSVQNDGEIVQARLRGLIPTDRDYLDRMRQIGYLSPAMAMEKLFLARQIPGPADLVRMMVRDSADDAVAAGYGYDKDFGAKFTGQVKSWAAAQGMDETQFKYLWRAHWDIPSNTALYSMFHRLRPDRTDVRVWDNEAAIHGPAGAELRLGPRPPVVELADVKRAMEVNDMAPTWVDPLLSVSYHPITNTDARRAFQIGFLTYDELVSRTRDNGYSPADAEMLARFFQAERERSITASTGVGSPRWILQAYVEGMIDYTQADGQLREYFPDPTVRANQLRKADFKASVETTRAAVRTSVKRFVMGEIDQPRLETDLGVVGVGPLGRQRIVSKAVAQRDGHKKEPRVTMIIDMYVRSMISRDQAYERMWRLGYFDADINNMLRLGAAKEQERQAVRAATEANRRRLEAKRDAEGALKLLKDEADRVSKQIDAARKELARLRAEEGKCGGTAGGSSGA